MSKYRTVRSATIIVLTVAAIGMIFDGLWRPGLWKWVATGLCLAAICIFSFTEFAIKWRRPPG